MGKITSIKGSKEQDVYKIEGEAFERIKKLSNETDIGLTKHREAAQEVHSNFWKEIAKEVGKEKLKANYTFNASYEKLGFYLVEKKNEENFLEKIVRDILK